MSQLLLLIDGLSQTVVFSLKLLVVRDYCLDLNIVLTDRFFSCGDFNSNSLSLLRNFDTFSLLLVIEVS